MSEITPNVPRRGSASSSLVRAMLGLANSYGNLGLRQESRRAEEEGVGGKVYLVSITKYFRSLNMYFPTPFALTEMDSACCAAVASSWWSRSS